MTNSLQALAGGVVFDGDRMRRDEVVLVREGLIEAIVPESVIPPEATITTLEGDCLAPGFIDVQVNGGGGTMLNDAPKLETVRRIAAAHRRFGTTGLLPTLITDTPETIRQAIAAVAAAMEAGVPGVLGLHLEGPFLNPTRRGVHDHQKMTPPTMADIALLTGLEVGRTLVTLAPERAPPGFIAGLVKAGAIVSIGHSDADYDVVKAALAEGASGFTHLFNAMSGLASRAPGVVGAALEDEASYCGVIVDGWHVHPASLRVAIAAKRASRMMLVTDAMPPVGTEARDFMLRGRPVRVEDGRCALEDGTLAGSVLDMASAVRNAVNIVGVSLEEALCMASSVPAAFLGLDASHGRIAPGYRADLVRLDRSLSARATWIGGNLERT